MMDHKIITKETLGALTIFTSAFCFYMMSIVTRWSREIGELSATYFVLTRCVFSFLILCIIFIVKRKPVRPKNVWLVLARSATYLIAVYCFFKAIELTTAAEANILHMTFPLYIALFYFLFNKGSKDFAGYLMTALAFVGIWLIVSPGGLSLRVESLWGIAAGFIGAIAVICLNLARRYDDTETILFFMFGLGAVVLVVLFPGSIHLPTFMELIYLVVVALLGGLGQYLLTLGFKFVTAVEGGVISSTRILLAAILGPVLVSDPKLTFGGWIGALLIFIANVYLAIRKVSFSAGRPEQQEHIGTMV